MKNNYEYLQIENKKHKNMRSQKEIEIELYKATDWTHAGKSDVEGMSYEEGVEAALRWALGEQNESPIENEYKEED